ncbi:MAG: sodium:solute symporter [Candidatus Marinimicrobia bacterium]|nr:sodium:solute symporter [Candidatus Neomarinimicrobiota bacterium]
MSWIDYVIIIVFMGGVFVAGTLLGRGVKDVKGYFSANNNLPWWAVMLSIVAAETSVLTFLSIPGLAYLGNFSFLQVCIGYIVGRIIISFVLLPMYSQGKFITVYQAITEKAGISMQRIMSITFMGTRLLADGVRLFAVAIPLSMITNLTFMQSIWILGIVTIIYTWFGGIKAVVWMDVVQWGIYISAAFIALYVGAKLLPDFSASLANVIEQGKTQIFDFKFSLKGYNVYSGLIGGAMLSMASHGTDQLIVQRVLSCKNLEDSKKALIGSGIVVFFQFALFLVIGLMMYMVWNGVGLEALGLQKPDALFTKFIIENLPPVVKGITVAGIFAAAMSTLSGSLSGLSSATTIDIVKPLLKQEIDDKKMLHFGRIATLSWGIFMVGGASLFRNMNNPLVEIGLSIASFTYGGMLGVFMLVRFFKKLDTWQYAVSFFGTIITMVFVIKFSEIHWTWFVLIGVLMTLIIEQITVLGKRIFGK